MVPLYPSTSPLPCPSSHLDNLLLVLLLEQARETEGQEIVWALEEELMVQRDSE